MQLAAQAAQAEMQRDQTLTPPTYEDSAGTYEDYSYETAAQPVYEQSSYSGGGYDGGGYSGGGNAHTYRFSYYNVKKKCKIYFNEDDIEGALIDYILDYFHQFDYKIILSSKKNILRKMVLPN